MYWYVDFFTLYLYVVSDQNTNIPYSPEYFELVPDIEKKFEDQIETILSVAQGEFVILKECESISLLMKTVCLLRPIVQELVFRSKSGQNVTLFTNSPDFVIQNKDINHDYV